MATNQRIWCQSVGRLSQNWLGFPHAHCRRSLSAKQLLRMIGLSSQCTNANDAVEFCDSALVGNDCFELPLADHDELPLRLCQIDEAKLVDFVI